MFRKTLVAGWAAARRDGKSRGGFCRQEPVARRAARVTGGCAEAVGGQDAQKSGAEKTQHRAKLFVFAIFKDIPCFAVKCLANCRES